MTDELTFGIHFFSIVFSFHYHFIMQRLTLEQRIQTLEFYIKNDRSVKQTYRDLRPIYGRNHRPGESTIRAICEKFYQTGSLLDQPHTHRGKTVRTIATLVAVRQSVNADRNESIRRRAQEVGLCPSTLWKILRKDLRLSAYKVQ